jgi:hypothetical protein
MTAFRLTHLNEKEWNQPDNGEVIGSEKRHAIVDELRRTMAFENGPPEVLNLCLPW